MAGLKDILTAIIEAIEYVFGGDTTVELPATLPLQPAVSPVDEIKPLTPTPMPSTTKYDFSSPESSRHSLRVICDEEGLSVEQKNLMSQVVHCESGYRNAATHPNLINGKVSSTDWGICQINDRYHVGPGKDFPSVEYVVNNPEACVRWMARLVKAGKINLWVCMTSGLYQNYSS